MSDSYEGEQKKYKGVRRRKWGKWVSEIRVPGTQERLWLGTYISPEAAAIAHDIAFYCLRETSSLDNLNFPSMLPTCIQRGMSPRSVQKAAGDAGMAIDAQVISMQKMDSVIQVSEVTKEDQSGLNYCTHDQFCHGSGSSLNENYMNAQYLNISVDDYL